MQDGTFDKFSGDVEVDETFIGGQSPLHAQAEARRKIKGTGPMGKTAVMGLLERHGPDGHSRVRVKTCPTRARATLAPRCRQHVEPGPRLHRRTRVLRGTGRGVHSRSDRPRGELRRGKVHTNGLENFWSLLKRASRAPTSPSSPSTCFAISTKRRSASTAARRRMGPASSRRCAASSASESPTRNSPGRCSPLRREGKPREGRGKRRHGK